MNFIDEIKSVPITDYAQRCGFTLVRKGQRYVSLREHDSVMIDTYRNCFWRNSVFRPGQSGGAGSIIDFAMEFQGYDRNKALRELALMYDISSNAEKKERTYKPVPKPVEIPKREVGDLELPPKADNAKAVWRYLLGERKIDRSVLRYFLAKKMLYQDAGHKNCVFVSHRFACVRSTSGSFRIDVPGCDYNECFFFRPKKEARTLVVAEGVIDIMSIMTQFAREGKRYTDYCYLALAGTNKLPSLFYHLEKEADIDHIMLAFDNDEAGQAAQIAACEGLMEKGFEGDIEIFTAPEGKDWNDYIKATAEE